MPEYMTHAMIKTHFFLEVFTNHHIGAFSLERPMSQCWQNTRVEKLSVQETDIVITDMSLTPMLFYHLTVDAIVTC